MSLQRLFMVLAGSNSGIAITLTGATISAANAGANAIGTLYIDNDGNTYEQLNGGAKTQINTVTDWIRPVGGAPGLYEVRYTSPTGDTGDLTTTAAVDTWYSLSSGDFTMSLTDSTVAPASKTVTFTIELRYDGGATLASASYTINADRDDS